MSDNPYEAPDARVDDPTPAMSDAVAERQAHLGREAGLRAVGVPCLLFGGFSSLGGVAFLAGSTWGETTSLSDLTVPGLLFLAIGVLGLASAWGYFRLRPWVRVLSLPVALLALLGSSFILAPLVGYATWLTWSRKGRRVLGADYAGVRAQARHLRAWSQPGEALVLLGILAAYAAIAAFLVNGLRGWD